ncbi:N-acetyltransferase family protein [Paenibacillus konkukensis]|uniref:GNAT family N-acetyltransferase n=1 Tax=Paenibacillus konkukensis TaxID=2020716 RepID=UPI003D9BDB88
MGRTLAVHSLETAKRCGYRAIQFNSVVSSNTASVKLWESLGFERAGMIRKAFMNPMNQPLDIYIYYREL